MSDETRSDVLGSLPHSRPHRRSEKRASRPANGEVTESTEPERVRNVASGSSGKTERSGSRAKAREPGTKARAKAAPTARSQRAEPRRSEPARTARLAQPAQPTGTPTGKRRSQPTSQGGHDILGTAVQAAAELAEIGLSVGARAIRRAVSRLPRP